MWGLVGCNLRLCDHSPAIIWCPVSQWMGHCCGVCDLYPDFYRGFTQSI